MLQRTGMSSSATALLSSRFFSIDDQEYSGIGTDRLGLGITREFAGGAPAWPEEIPARETAFWRGRPGLSQNSVLWAGAPASRLMLSRAACPRNRHFPHENEGAGTFKQRKARRCAPDGSGEPPHITKTMQHLASHRPFFSVAKGAPGQILL